MADEKDQLEIQLEDAPVETPEVEIVDTQASDPASAKETAAKPDDQDDVEQAIKNLDQRLKKERKAREEAEKYARYIAEQANKAYEEVGETQFHLVVNALETVKRDNEILKSQLAEANSLGDYSKVAEIQEALSLNAVKINQLETGKREMEGRPKTPAFTPPPVSPAIDPIEQIIEAVSKPSADWIQKNRQYIKGDADIQDMFDAHASAVRRGFAPDTDAYFRYVEQKMGIPNDGGEPEVKAAPAAPVKKAAPPAAPVSRGGTGTGSRPNVVRLTSDEAEMAEMMGMTHQEYAKHKLELQKAGRLPN